MLARLARAPGLRPLERISTTADAIAAPATSPSATTTTTAHRGRTVGRKLNTMLDSIEQAFAERRESERRLREFRGDASHEPADVPPLGARATPSLPAAVPPSGRIDLETTMRRIEAEAARMGGAGGRPAAAGRLGRGPPIERRRLT